LAIVINPEPGIVLTGEFERGAPGTREEMQQFIQQLTRLKQQQGFAAFIPVASEREGRLTLSIIAVALGAPGSVAADDVGQMSQAIGRSLGDRFTGSGRLVAPPGVGHDPYMDKKELDAGDMLANWFENDAKPQS
jgi:hypothetical protein